MKNKKSQITAFIIIGIILLFSTALIIYIKDKVSESTTSIKPITEEVPNWAEPVKLFTESCIKDKTEEALILLGEHGGYIYPEKNGIIPNLADATEGKGVEFIFGSNITIPYWFYLSASNTCKGNCNFRSEAPNLYKSSEGDNSIESQIEEYIKEKLPLCLDNYQDLKEQGFTIETGVIKPTVKITEKNVAVKIDFPITLKKDQSETKITQFYTENDLNLKKIYELAKQITNYQMNSTFLEQNAVTLISGFSTASEKNILPPISGVDFERQKKTWEINEAKTKLGQMLMSYVPLMQIFGTSNYEAPTMYDSLTNSLLISMVVPINPKYTSGLEVNQVNLGWPFYMKINSKSSGLLEPDQKSASIDFLFLSVTSYEFSYDLSYPVVFEITDKEALNNKGYSFKFALESNLRNNFALFKDNSSSLKTTATVKTTIFCDEQQKNTGDIKITIKDYYTDEQLEGVSVMFCIPDETGNCLSTNCDLGETIKKGNNASLLSKMPIGFGKLILAKEGYQTKEIPFITQFNMTKNFTFELELKKEINISAKFRVYQKEIHSDDSSGLNIEIPYWALSNNIKYFEPGENAIITFTREKEDEYDKDYSAYSNLDYDTNTSSIKLIPGNYTIDMVYLLNIPLSKYSNITIPQENESYCDCICCGIWPCCDEEITTLDPVVFDSDFPLGGLKIQTPYKFEITREDLKKTNLEITGLAIRVENLTTHNDLEQLNFVEETSKSYWSQLKPVFSR